MTSLSPTCPRCGASALEHSAGDGMLCPQCGARIQPAPPTCPACGTEVSTEAEDCQACGSPLGIAARVIAQRGGKASPIWLERTRAEAPGLKAAGEVGSRDRFQDLVEIDHRRQQRWADDLARRAAEDRRLIGILAVAAAVFITVLGAALFVVLWR